MSTKDYCVMSDNDVAEFTETITGELHANITADTLRHNAATRENHL